MLALGAMGIAGSRLSAHFLMLLPDKPSVRLGETITLLYQFGHPYEHQLFDAPAPQKFIVRSPDGKVTDVAKALEPCLLSGSEGKTVAAFRYRITPKQRGDYIVRVDGPPVWLEEDQEFIQDSARVVVHVQAQKGWDAGTDADFELLPLTRPYGVEAGQAFQVLVHGSELYGPMAPSVGGVRVQPVAKPRPAALVEVELYHDTAPATLPADEFITRVVKADPSGVATATLLEPGWWCLAAQRDGGTRKQKGKNFPVRQRAIMWVHVDRSPAGR